MTQNVQKLKAILGFIDSYLEESGLSCIDAVEANALLARAGLLTDSLARPGLPMRRLLRDGLIPHAYQENGRGSRWVIPHSTARAKNKPKASEAKPKPDPARYIVSDGEPGTNGFALAPSRGSTLHLVEVLDELRRNQFHPALNAGHLPDRSGAYLICLSKGRSLPKTEVVPKMQLFEGLQVIYAGISIGSLRKRDYRQHFNGSAGRSTLRKSLGVLFGYQLIPRDNNPTTGKTKLPDRDEGELSRWMQASLTMFYVITTDCHSIEAMLIDYFNPPLNLKGNNNPVNAEFRNILGAKRNTK